MTAMALLRGSALLCVLLAGCARQPPRPDVLQGPGIALLAALAFDTPVVLAAAPGGAAFLQECLGSLLEPGLAGPLARAKPGFALGWSQEGLLALLPASAASDWDQLRGRKGVHSPAGSDLVAWAEGAAAHKRAVALAGRFSAPAGDLGAARILPELAQVVPWQRAAVGLWVGLAGLRQGSLSSLFLQVPGLSNLFEGGGAPAQQELLDVLNLEAFEAVLLLLDPDRSLRGGLYCWPDRVGLAGLLLGAEEGLAAGLPPGTEGVLVRLAPARILNLLEGTRLALGGAGASLLTGQRAALLRALARGLDGTVYVGATEAGTTLGLRLAAGPAGESLKALALGSGLLAGLLSGAGGPEITSTGQDLFLRFGANAPEPFPLPAGNSGSAWLAELRLPLPTEPRIRLEARLERVDWGLSLTGRLQTP